MEGVEDIPGAVLHEGLDLGLAVVPGVPGRARRPPVRRRRRAPGAARRAAPARDGRARRRPRGRDPRRHRGDGGARRGGDRAPARSASRPRARSTTAPATASRRRRSPPRPTSWSASPSAIGATGRGRAPGRVGLRRRRRRVRRSSGAMAEASGRPLSFSLVADPRATAGAGSSSCSSEANADGVTMTGQVAPRAVGLLLGLQCTLHPLLTNPVYREIAALGRSPSRSRDPARPGVPGAGAGRGRAAATRPGRRADHRRLRRACSSSATRPTTSRTPPTSIAAPGRSATGATRSTSRTTCCSADEGRAFLYVPFLNYVDGNLDAAGEMLAHPHTVAGLGDGGAHVGTICDASFPTTLLALWGRDRDHGRLDAAVPRARQHTRTPPAPSACSTAACSRPGYRADVNVIDFERLRRPAPEMRHDLPAGGRRLVQARRRLRRHDRRRRR